MWARSRFASSFITSAVPRKPWRPCLSCRAAAAIASPSASGPREVAEAELRAAADIGAHALFVGEPGSAQALAAVDPPPPLIYVKGNTGHLSRPMLAIVGARNGSAAGQKLARLFASTVGAQGFVIVSGLARGIDSAAHEAALATGTVAVLAGGPDNVYPPEHADLQRELVR